jgi:hypothetical protein
VDPDLPGVLARFDTAGSPLPVEIVEAERVHGLRRLAAVAIEGSVRAPDPPALLAYARDAILRSDMTREEVGQLVGPLLEQLAPAPRTAGDAALAFSEWLVLDGRLDASLLRTLGVDYAVGHHVLALPRCLHACDAARLRELAASSSPWVRWAALDFVAESIQDPRRPCDLEQELLDGWLDDPFEPVARLARHAKEDRRIDELVWSMRDRPRSDPDHAAAREQMRQRRRRPTTFADFELAFRASAGQSADYTEGDLERFLVTMTPG